MLIKELLQLSESTADIRSKVKDIAVKLEASKSANSQKIKAFEKALHKLPGVNDVEVNTKSMFGSEYADFRFKCDDDKWTGTFVPWDADKLKIY